MKKLLFYYMSCACLLYGCCVGKSTYVEYKRYFDNRLEGKNTGLDSLIRLDGYYAMKGLRDATSTSNFIFFENGTYAQFSSRNLPQKGIGYGADRQKYGPYAFLTYRDGVYSLYHDTIKVQGLMQGACFVFSDYFEHWYKIIDEQTLKYIYCRYTSGSPGPIIERKIENEYSLATFIPLDTLPSSDFGFKEDRFFWRHESDWREYMEKINTQKNKSSVLFDIQKIDTTAFYSNNNSIKENSIILAESNLMLLNGKYERRSINLNKDAHFGDLYSNFFGNLYSEIYRKKDYTNLRSDSDYFDLKVIAKNKILVSYLNENKLITSKTLKGKIKNGYFEFRKQHLFISLLLYNMCKNSKFRITLTSDHNLLTDYKYSLLANLLIIPIIDKGEENNMIYKRIDKGNE